MGGVAPSGSGWRDGRLAAVLVTAIWTVAYSRWVLADQTVPWDAKNQFYAFFRFLAAALHDGGSIFWNPYHYGGHPSIADPQSLIFAPLFLAWAALDSAPSMAAFDCVVYAHLLAGGLAMVSIGQRRGWPVSASVLAATVFMLGGAAAGRLNHTGIIISYGLFPVAIFALEIALARRSVAYAIAFAVIASLIALGRNQVAMLLCLTLAALVIATVIAAPRPLAYLRSRGPVIATIAAVGIVLTIVPLLLTLQFAGLSNRPAMSLSTALEASLHPAVLATSAVPNLFGSHNMNFRYWGPHYTIMPEVGATDDSFNYLFFGAVPVLLLLWLGIAGGRLATRGARFWAIVLAVAVLFSLGRYGPLFPVVFDHLPGFSYFRRPIDGMFVAGIALAMLCGHLLSGYVRYGRPQANPWAVTAVLIAAAAILTGALRIAAISNKEWEAAFEIGKMIPVVGLAAVALRVARTRFERDLSAGLLALIAVAELTSWNAAARFNAEPRAVYAALETMTPAQQAAIDVLNRELANRHRHGERPRVEIVNMGGPWQNLAMVRAIEATNGYNPLRIGLYDRMVSPGEMPSQGREFTRTFSGFDCALARALGVEYLVTGTPIESLGERSRAKAPEIIHAGQGIFIYRFRQAMPRAIFHARIEVADADALGFDGYLRHPPAGDRAVIDEETPVQSRYWLSQVANGEAAARIRSWKPGRVEVDLRAPSPGVLVLHDTYYPGWVATLDGTAVPILRADTLFRGVEVPAGDHRVVFEYKPLSLSNLTEAARGIASGFARSR